MFKAWLKKHLSYRSYLNISIKSRLLIYFISLVILPTSIILITVYYKSTSIITEKTNSSLRNNLNLIDADIEKKLDTIYNNVITNIYLNKDIIRILSSDSEISYRPTIERPTSQTEIVSEMNTIDKILESYQTQSLGENVIIPKLYMNNRPEYLMYSFSDKVSDISMLVNEQWYLKMPAELKYKVVGLNKITISSAKLDTIKIATRLFGIHNTDIPYAACLTIDVGIDEFISTLNSFKPSTNSSIFIVDADNSIILSPDKSQLGKSLTDKPYIGRIITNSGTNYNSFIQNIDGSDILVSYEKMEPVNWTIIALSPMSELNGELIAFNRIMLVVIIICMILAFAMVLYLSENISYPIRKLVKSMSVVRSGNFDISIDYKRNDEFGYLINAYKKMLHDINELIQKLFVSEANKREAELKLLQAQINPHFLYNTLDSVNWLSMKYKATDISTMVTSLSDFFRYSLSKGKNIIPLEDEKKQVESYLTIQKIRFKDKLDYTIDLPSDILGCLTVKLILQPIVENSIVHGIENRRGKGEISIIAENKDGIIAIAVSDNGIGADVDELNSILEDNIVSSSFAIRNVNERIKHFFGDEFGLKFFDNENSGVKVIIRFPAIKSLEELNAKNDNSGR